ncbi:glycosyltransferase family 2 protein [Methanobacterium sp. CWC-01]|uniref:glycosyltransferase family 2 protein n=1 Tax=Methanobacterium aridiramus TaxID=2584467 RepID=UPI002576091E|nr:glycosyltransferase family 2 protein [Methanobacterium sp. CWC-01]WJI10168.1 glycosyltransferase family 2 protein [Methanobacterium sp. CWC-01]
MGPNVGIIILNWNGWEDTLECLESLYKINYENYHVVLVDNGSDDDSIEKINEYCSNKTQHRLAGWTADIKLFELEEKDFNHISINKKEKNINKELILLKNAKNYGYAKGNNIGIRFTFMALNPEYILLLNNDTTVDRNFLKELMEAAKNQERVGIYAPKILRDDNHKIIDSTGHIINWGRIIDRGYKKVDKNQYDHQREIIGAKGAAALYKSEMLQSVGLFKEDYIISYEDAELSWRAHKKSWKAIYVPKSVVYHKGERSIKKDNDKMLYFKKLSLNNMAFTVKEYGTINQKIQFTLILIREMILSHIPILRNITNSEKLNYIHTIKHLYKN